MKIFLDTGDPEFTDDPRIEGFTTNPSLIKKAGFRDYQWFCWQMLEATQGRPVSFEVLADSEKEMCSQARRISGWDENVYVKIPIMNTKGESMVPLIRKLSADGIKVNVTAVFTYVQFADVLRGALGPSGTPSIISVFAGRIADTGRDPQDLIANMAGHLASLSYCQLLWASAREVLNVRQAEKARADIITLTPELLAKLPLLGRDPEEFSLDTVRKFYIDGQGLAFS